MTDTTAMRALLQDLFAAAVDAARAETCLPPRLPAPQKAAASCCSAPARPPGP